MEPKLIRIGSDLIINPAFIAFARRDEGDGTLEIHMGGAPSAADQGALRFCGPAAKQVWAALESATNPGAKPEGR